jgi:ATP-dependent Clp protease ATP-binding subunit ClpA
MDSAGPVIYSYLILLGDVAWHLLCKNSDPELRERFLQKYEEETGQADDNPCLEYSPDVDKRSEMSLEHDVTFNLDTDCKNLTKIAEANGLDPVIGRDREIERAVQILGRRKKGNVILLGSPGVGKTAIVHGIAERVHMGRMPKDLQWANIYALDMGTLMAGTKLRGELEAKVKMMIDQLRDQDNAILFIDEIHMINDKDVKVGNLLKPFLTDGSIRCIGATTHEEYRSYIEKDRALVRRFQCIDVKEPSLEMTKKILTGTVEKYQDYHNVLYTEEAIDLAIHLANKHITTSAMPV